MRNRVLIIAGEASGDLHGANLVKAMRAVDPSIIFRGVGSNHMLEAGVGLIWDAAEMAVVGLPGVGRLATIFKAFRMVSSILHRWRPDLVVLIDYPEFNLLIARKANKLGIPVMYYISPQIWAWRSGRVNTIRRRVDRMVVILPFEEKIYREAGVRASFVGNPLLDVVRVKDKEELTRSRYVQSGNDRLVGLLPGSRFSELSRLMPVMLDAAEILTQELPSIRFLMPLAPTIRREQVDSYLKDRDLPLTVVEHNTYEIIQMCEIIVAASGTVTLEAAILGTPLVVVYRMNSLTYWIAKRLVRVKHVALANLVASQTVVPELIQHDARPERIAQEVRDILDNTTRQEWIKKQLTDVRRKLGSPGASEKAAAIALELMGKSYPAGTNGSVAPAPSRLPLSS